MRPTPTTTTARCRLRCYCVAVLHPCVPAVPLSTPPLPVCPACWVQGLLGHKRASVARLAALVAQQMYVKPGVGVGVGATGGCVGAGGSR